MLHVAMWATLLVGVVSVAGGEGDVAEVRAQAPAISVDRPGDVVVDAVERRNDGTVVVTGWRRHGGAVDIIVDGVVRRTVTADQPRFDVARALGLTNAAVGFRTTVDGSDAFLVCAASAASTPAAGACSRTVVDLGYHRMVAFYGVPGSPTLGTLGAGTAASARDRLVAQAAPYRTPSRPVVHAFEIIATVAQASPGADGDYSAPIDPAAIWAHLDVIRGIEGHLVLDFQPGRGDYLTQISAVEDLLRQPDVHLALDPEWDMLSHQVPAQVVGHTTAAEINRIMGYVDELVRTHRLPPKVVIVHQFQEQMIRDRPALDPPDTVQLVLQMDGHGPPWLKTGNYTRLSDARFLDGFKLFYQRDIPLLDPAAVLALVPEVDYVSYQ